MVPAALSICACLSYLALPTVPSSLGQFPQRRTGLLQPVRHVDLAVHRRCSGEVFFGLLAPARALVELAEAEVAVSDEGAHAARLTPREAPATIPLASSGSALRSVHSR